MKNILFALSAIVIALQTIVHAHFQGEVRATETCADPTGAVTYWQGVNTATNAHWIHLITNFVDDESNGSVAWSIDNQLFRAFPTQQENTVPLYHLNSPSTSDNLYLLANNGTLPSRPGFTLTSTVAYVYATQVCGSIPLYSLSKQANTDHVHTTDTFDHSQYISLGWVDAGIVAYVLPLNDGCNCSN